MTRELHFPLLGSNWKIVTGNGSEGGGRYECFDNEEGDLMKTF